MAKSGEELIKPKKFRRGVDLGSVHAVAAQPIEEMPAPNRLFVPLKQHRGSYCLPKVQAGDRVLIGQILGESSDPEAAPVHAPVSGEVASVTDHVDPFGQKIPAVTIENDRAEEWTQEPAQDPRFMKKKISVMIRAIRESGLVEARTGRPVYSMLAPPERPKSYIFLVGIPMLKPVQLIIVNALDPEPTMVVNRRLLLEETGALNEGLKLIKKIVGVQEAVLALSDDLGEPAHILGDLVGDDLKPIRFKNRYPTACSEILTTTVTGREVPWPGGEPRDVGVIVLDVEIILGLLDAVRIGRPQIDRVVTVLGPEMTPRNLRVRIGTPLKDLISFAGGSFDDAAKVIIGGLMDGSAQYSDLTPVTKQTRAVHILSSDNLVTFNEQLCFKCGRCVGVCPMRLQPNVITNYCEFGFFTEAAEADLFKCIECGCCAYVCPAQRPLVHYIKHGKAEVTAMRTAR